ncbi:protein SPEAR3-like [Bidens hawaiensis]|uniref:protein SPEAR3-like n=1 Tax=Bidens hawaiensis TaxID=980011 RepID=UPI00404B7F8A
MQMGMSELERSNIAYVQSQPSRDPRWNASNAIFEAEHYAKPGLTMHLFQLEDSLGEKKWSDSMGSSSHNYDSNGSQEMDLELRLSL